MPRKSLYIKKQDQTNIFQSFTDLMSNAFMILCLFLLLALLQSQKLNQNLRQANKRLQSASPILIDEKSKRFRFPSGSAELSSEIKKHLREETLPEIKQNLRDKDIDFIQVIGHTDGQVINQSGNLDKNLEQVAQGEIKVKELIPGSNTDLGLMRALAVVQELQKTRELKDIKFRAYSAGQLYLDKGELAGVERKKNSARRRIEIRFIPAGQSLK